jgi:Holin of 3TMs, for gene-transfer release
MGLLSGILGGGAADAVGAVGNAFDKLFTSDEERQQAQVVLERLRQNPHILQAEVNKIEAGHRSLFVAGWRPFIGWVCGIGLLWAFLGQPVFAWAVALWGLDITPPQIVTENMMELVLALLGLGGLRSFEKFTGRAK